jgi:hypothetical protein
MFIQYLWGLLNDMSFLTVLTMISLSVPGMAKIIQQILMNFIYLDLLQTDKWLIPLIFPENDEKTENLVERASDKPINLFFDENGYSSRLLIKNLGSTFIYLIILVTCLALIPVLTLLSSMIPM